MTVLALPPARLRSGNDGPYPAAVALDRSLGDPRATDNPFGFAAMVGRDQREEFPAQLANRVGATLRLAFVPAGHGGNLSTMDETMMLVRVAARRDVTVMPATMFSITATTCVLLSGDAQQRERIVELLRSGGTVGFAFSEAEHGSDLLANSCTLEKLGDGGFRLDGDKWLVGLGERCDELLVVGRTGGRGPAAFSAVLLDRDTLRTARNGRRQRPTGMRGIDFAGFRFGGIRIPPQALVGGVGRGMETAMKAMQVVRTMSTAANLACSDTGLRLAMDFAVGHIVAGKAVTEHAQSRRELATAAAALMACDAVALSCARGLHSLPASQSVWSSVAKKLLTDCSEEIFSRCADVLGTRSLLRDGPAAAFETARRDNAVVRYIDTSPVANTRLIAMQLGQLASGVRPPDRSYIPVNGPAPEPSEELAAAFTLDAELPELRLERLELSTRGRDEVLATLPNVASNARSVLDGSDELAMRAAVRIGQVETALSGLFRELPKLQRQFGGALGTSAELYDIAERFCYLHAAASCVHLWWFNRHLSMFGTEPGSTGWLSAALSVLLDRAFGTTKRLETPETEVAFSIVRTLHEQGRLFSPVALPLAESDSELSSGDLDQLAAVSSIGTTDEQPAVSHSEGARSWPA